MRARRVAGAAALVGGLVAWPLADPARAAVTATGAGTVVTVTMTGEERADFACTGGNLTVNGLLPSPAVTCAALTQVTVNGDAGAQTVIGDGLDAPAFTAGPRLVATLGGGADWVQETARADTLDLGAGTDVLRLWARGPANTTNALGADGDIVRVQAPSSPATLAVSSSGATATVTATTTGSPVASTVTGAERIDLAGHDGDDTLTAAGVTAGSTLTNTILEGGEGDDALTGGAKASTLYGGGGTNTLTGGSAPGSFWSASETDVLVAGSTGVEQFLYDADGLRSGGRTLTGFGPEDALFTQANAADTVVRVRPGASPGVSRQTVSLHRTGQQTVPVGFGTISPSLGYVGQVPHRTLTDVHALGGRNVWPNGQIAVGGLDLLDVTVPGGTWTTTTGPGGQVSVVTDEPTLGDVVAANIEDHRVHGPWTNANQGFAHRVTRDLLFRFPSNAARDAIRDQLTAGTRTRAQVVSSMVNTDEYRGLDVDRVFVAFLRRPSDPSGRAYWINGLRTGKSLRLFRAQLFGSSEYFTKAGGTNADYVVKAYADVLGRRPDAAGQAYWTNKLATGTGRGSVALQFLATTEARRNIVDDQFLRFLDRPAVTSEQDEWIGILGTSVNGEQGLVSALAASASYYARS